MLDPGATPNSPGARPGASPKDKSTRPTGRHGSTSNLILGWRVTASDDPAYWLDRGAAPGNHTDSDLVKVRAEALATHTAIIAQSGSGKSSLLGRLVEELLVQTKADCLILDPNADFRKVREIADATLWESAAYDSANRCGKLPHEASREQFRSKWSRVPIQITVGDLVQNDEPPYKRLQLWWPALSVDFLAEDLDRIKRSELYHCHAFVQAVGTLLGVKATGAVKPPDVIDIAEELYRRLRRDQSAEVTQVVEAGRRATLDKMFNVAELEDAATQRGASPFPWWVFSKRNKRRFMRIRMEGLVERALTALDYVSDDVGRFYFAKAREYKAARILAEEPPVAADQRERLRVIDLPSVPDKGTRLLAISTLVATESDRARRTWEKALAHQPDQDDRVPTFIVIDEAHNLVPAEATSKAELALKEQFRTIVAEGRKYGLFLVLATQRPDKLDPLILSECENKALMKLNSQNVLSMTRQLLSLEDISSRVLSKTLQFGIGRALIAGPWSPDGPQVLYTAARRTIEGGRNLRAKHWALPYSAAKASTSPKVRSSRTR